jgi:Leucine-rich repeat (LRR) protein
VLDVSDNALTGGIPDQLSSAAKLKVVRLAKNKLTSLPILSGLLLLNTLDVSRNAILGPFPRLSASVKELDLSFNRFGGLCLWLDSVFQK